MCMENDTLEEVILFGCWKTSSQLSVMNQHQMISVLRDLLSDDVSGIHELIDDASAVAFFKLNGLTLASILAMTFPGRRAEMEASLAEHFQVLYALPQPTELTDIQEHCAIIK